MAFEHLKDSTSSDFQPDQRFKSLKRFLQAQTILEQLPLLYDCHDIVVIFRQQGSIYIDEIDSFIK